MTYPRKPRCFKSDYQIEVERRQAITAAYQTLYKEVYEENKKLKKNLAQIQRDHFHTKNTNHYLEVELDRQKEELTVVLNEFNEWKGITK